METRDFVNLSQAELSLRLDATSLAVPNWKKGRKGKVRNLYRSAYNACLDFCIVIFLYKLRFFAAVQCDFLICISEKLIDYKCITLYFAISMQFKSFEF